MAVVDREKRIEIGALKRARTRARIVAAARRLLAARPWPSIRIDDLVREAGVAKGTFYGHFDDMDALAASVANELVEAMADLSLALRLATADPLTRVALGCDIFIRKAIDEPQWGALVARMVRSDPRVGASTQAQLRADLAEALAGQRGGGAMSVELALEVVVGILLQVLAALSDGRLDPAHRIGAIAAILGAIGVDSREIAAQLDRLPAAEPR